MVTALNQDASNDIFIDSSTSDISTVSGKKAYAIIIRDAVRTLVGELQYNTDVGVPYMETVFDNPSFIGMWKSRVQETVYSFDFVKAITDFTVVFQPSSRILTYSLTFTTDDGDETIIG